MRSNDMRLVVASGPAGRVDWSEESGLATLVVGELTIRLCPTALRQLTRTLIDATCVMSQLEARCDVVRHVVVPPPDRILH